MKTRKNITTFLAILSFHAHAIIPIPHPTPFASVDKETKEGYSHCMDEAQSFGERRSCGQQLMKRLTEAKATKNREKEQEKEED